MAYDAPDQLTDGTLMLATRWNQDVVNNTIFLHSPPGVILGNTSASTLVSAFNNPSTFSVNTEVLDNAEMAADVGGGRYAQIDIPVQGVYTVTLSVSVEHVSPAVNIPAGSTRLWLQRSDGFVIASTSFQNTAAITVPFGLACSGLAWCDEGQNIIWWISQTHSSSDIRIVASSFYVAAHWVSAGEATP